MRDLREQRPSLTVSLCRHFEEVAGIAGNRCIERCCSLMGVDRQVTVGVFIKTHIYKKYLFFFDVAHNKRHGLQLPFDIRNGQFNLVEIQLAATEMFVRERRWV